VKIYVFAPLDGARSEGGEERAKPRKQAGFREVLADVACSIDAAGQKKVTEKFSTTRQLYSGMASPTAASKREMLRHFLAALAYRTQKALRGAPAEFAAFSPGNQTRTPKDLLRHMSGVLGYARTFFIGGSYRAQPLETLEEEIIRFHALVEDLANYLDSETPLTGVTEEQLLQGPFSDAMTHAGQLAMLRRLAGVPVAPENFVFADIHRNRLGPDQPAPAAADAIWPERLAGDVPAKGISSTLP